MSRPFKNAAVGKKNRIEAEFLNNANAMQYKRIVYLNDYQNKCIPVKLDPYKIILA